MDFFIKSTGVHGFDFDNIIALHDNATLLGQVLLNRRYIIVAKREFVTHVTFPLAFFRTSLRPGTARGRCHFVK